MNPESQIRKPPSRRDLIRWSGIVIAAALAACTPENRHYMVKINAQNHYEPASLIIPVGAIVTWQNIGLRLHTATCDTTKAHDARHVALPENAQAWDSGQLYPGQTWSHTFDTPGSYLYFSRTHESDTMLGTITVTG